MTPERLAEIKRGYHVGCVAELLAEIDRLNKVVDQAIAVGDIRLSGDRFQVTSSYPGVDLNDAPELAAELQRRGNERR